MIVDRKEGKIADGKLMRTEARLEAGGRLTVDTYTRSFNWFLSLRGRVLVVCHDARGRCVWVSPEYLCARRCAAMGTRQGTDSWIDHFPVEVVKTTASLEIIHSDHELGQVRDKMIDKVNLLVTNVAELSSKLGPVVGLLRQGEKQASLIDAYAQLYCRL